MITRLFVPQWVKQHNFKYESLDKVPDEVFTGIRESLKKFNTDNPLVSIVIPAYNEEQDILKTLSSLSKLNTRHKTEIIVANNNSTDRTQQVLERCGVRTVFAQDQGISYARQAGIEAAKGKYIMSADADSIYPPDWVDPYVEALQDQSVSCVYGRYSFIPSEDSTRLALAFHEVIAAVVFYCRKKGRQAIYVMGFNSAFRKDDALKVGGYHHNLNREITERSEDGWMALMLGNVGKIKLIHSGKVLVWTSDRRLMMDGGLRKAFMMRSKREVKRVIESYTFGMPVWVNNTLKKYDCIDDLSDQAIEKLRMDLQKFNVDDPEVTISIPVYNEEKHILKTLASLSKMVSKYRTELLFVNNNSTDRTKEILSLLNVKVIDEPVQGISFARQTGLEHARGKYLLNADGDTIYPPNWIDPYVEKLKNPEVACAYGRYSFIPSKNSSRLALGMYEVISRLLFSLRRKKMDFFNVLGFNFAFRREDGIKVGGFNTMRQRWSDGWMAMTLMELGRIEIIKEPGAKVWTSDRRLMYDGGLSRAILKRLRKEIGRYGGLLKPQSQV